MRYIVFFFWVLLGSLLFGHTWASMTGKVTAKVIDETGVPLEGAEAKVTYKFAKNRGIGLDTRAVKGFTDDEGLFTATGEGMASISISAIKNGYYKSGKGFEFTSFSKLHNRWEPWNPTVEVVLKKMRNPVPMYVKYIEAADIPVIDAEVGYDLEKGDWVAPYGTGAVNDLLFFCQNKYENFKNAETSCEISFSNPEDGFQEYRFNKNDQSYFKWPFEAPLDGYTIKKLNKWMSVHLPEEGYKSNFKASANYIFRVRSETDSGGNIIKANYGKIKGDIRVYKKGQINIFYYFNPDGTRNLEEDPKRNLFTMK